MARLPQPGGDEGNWGQILNEFLSQTHATDGSLKSGIITAQQLAPNAVNEAALGTGSGTDGQVLVKDSSVSSGIAWRSTTGTGTVPDASGSQKGLVQLAGDLGGTAAAPTVPGLAGKADNVHTHAQSDITGLSAALTAKLDASQKGAASGVASLDASGKVPAAQLPAAGATPDATSTVKGVVQLAGDLGGTAAAPTVPGLAGKANNVHTHAAADITSGTLATARLGSGTANNTTFLRGDGTWATPPAGGGGSAWSFRTVTGDTTAANGEYVLANATSVGITVTLPAATNGAVVRVKRISTGSNSVQVIPQSPAVIDGAGVGSDVLGNQWDCMEYVSNGTNWYRG